MQPIELESKYINQTTQQLNQQSIRIQLQLTTTECRHNQMTLIIISRAHLFPLTLICTQLIVNSSSTTRRQDIDSTYQLRPDNDDETTRHSLLGLAIPSLSESWWLCHQSIPLNSRQNADDLKWRALVKIQIELWFGYELQLLLSQSDLLMIRWVLQNCRRAKEVEFTCWRSFSVRLMTCSWRLEVRRM